MKNNKKQCCIVYNAKEDSFDLYINSGNGWDFSFGAICQKRNENDDEANFITYQLINEISNCVNLGYEFIGKKDKQFIE